MKTSEKVMLNESLLQIHNFSLTKSAKALKEKNPHPSEANFTKLSAHEFSAGTSGVCVVRRSVCRNHPQEIHLMPNDLTKALEASEERWGSGETPSIQSIHRLKQQSLRHFKMAEC